jgi:alkanesulfonate monooxygenase SsuD/methylene tetrahydromethanopterin reductase-like flavin-dependent oxidoreductase (luciferase family)
VARPAARALLVLFAVGLWTGPAAAAEAIRVGFMGPLTGIFAQAGKDMLDGLKMALEQVNYQAGGRRIELIDYLRAPLAIAGTPEDCVAQVRAAEAAGVTRLMFTVSLAADPERAVELFGKAVLPRFARA